jgi:protein-S-isoprenylcysteine O-methyltransferase Ste14
VFTVALVLWAAAAVAAYLLLWRIPAPYGRFARPGWGPGVPPRLAWFLMEGPGFLVFAGVMAAGLPCGLVPALFGALYLAHYAYRGFLYPALLRSATRVPLFVVLSAVGFHLANGTLQAWEIFHRGIDRPVGWLLDPRFLAGLALFAGGFALHVSSDARLRGLRPVRGAPRVLPQGGMFDRVSSPNYLGEIVQWCGWALLTWTWSGLVFALWTVANLLPRAVVRHRAYRESFPAYPPERTALFPGIPLRWTGPARMRGGADPGGTRMGSARP